MKKANNIACLIYREQAKEDLAMHTQLVIEIAAIKNVDHKGKESGSDVMIRRLVARVARRPGRWRRSMRSRHDFGEEQLGFHQEAA